MMTATLHTSRAHRSSGEKAAALRRVLLCRTAASGWHTSGEDWQRHRVECERAVAADAPADGCRA
jgi:hypothetical protein